MMGMMGAGMMGATYGSGSGMMGTGSGGGMMGFGYGSPSNSSDWSSGDTVMVVLMGVLIALAILALVAWRPWRREGGDTALEMLRARFARGDIDQDEYDRLRQALGGAA